LFRQKVGRIGRILPGVIDGIEDPSERRAAIARSAKPDALILDLLWQTERFGLMGPADLIAGNEEEKKAIQGRLAGLRTATDLQEVTAEVQAEREQKLKEALKAAARRFSQFRDTAPLIATLLHSKELMDYEPRMKWERKPVTVKQREWLVKHSIDPDSVKCAGHATALMTIVIDRERRGLCGYRTVEALEKRSIDGAVRMTDWQAYQILGGNYPFPFGKHAQIGSVLRQIPLGFWQWAMKQDWIRQRYPIVGDWMLSVMDPRAHAAAQAACTCIGAHQAPNCPTHPRKVYKEPEPPPSPARDDQATLALFDCFD
jgi:hypothetical protein